MSLDSKPKEKVKSIENQRVEVSQTNEAINKSLFQQNNIATSNENVV
jgi:hypothetical protein